MTLIQWSVSYWPIIVNMIILVNVSLCSPRLCSSLSAVCCWAGSVQWFNQSYLEENSCSWNGGVLQKLKQEAKIGLKAL